MTRKALARLGAMDHLALFEEALSVLRRAPIKPSGGSPHEVPRGLFAVGADVGVESSGFALVQPAGGGAHAGGHLRANPEAVWEADD